jgi:hypothetical protein
MIEDNQRRSGAVRWVFGRLGWELVIADFGLRNSDCPPYESLVKEGVAECGLPDRDGSVGLVGSD